MTDDTARSDALREETPQEARNRLRAEVIEAMAGEEYDAGFVTEVRDLLGPDEPNVLALAAPAAEPREGLCAVHVHVAGQPPNHIDRCEECGHDLRATCHARDRYDPPDCPREKWCDMPGGHDGECRNADEVLADYRAAAQPGPSEPGLTAGLRAALDVLHADARDPKRASAWRYGVRHTLSVIERALSKQQETPR